MRTVRKRPRFRRQKREAGVGLGVELAGVVNVAVDLDDQPEVAVEEVDPADPGLAAQVDLTLGQWEAGFHHEGEEPSLEATGRGDVAGATVGEELAHQGAARPPVLEQLDGDRPQLLQGHQLAGQGVVESPLGPQGMEAAGQVEDRPRRRGHRDALTGGPVMRRQVARLVHLGGWRRPAIAVALLADARPVVGEARKTPQASSRVMGDHGALAGRWPSPTLLTQFDAEGPDG
ncbi:MAG: hypothetical protein KY441_01775, partial [Actinobacteria bacterium]|nr:hypothetical protein [Actinomycetota bacterium]